LCHHQINKKVGILHKPSKVVYTFNGLKLTRSHDLRGYADVMLRVTLRQKAVM